MALNVQYPDEKYFKQDAVKAAPDFNLIYEMLKKHLSENSEEVSEKAFRAVFDAVAKLASEYVMTGTEDVASACEASFCRQSFISPEEKDFDMAGVKDAVLSFWHVLKPVLDKK